ncbi:MBL fold metallo-hydrolase [Bacillus tianshenii]|nr:MBL fold metallo-hydrolase [Bacillus tianshenii]
MNDIHQMSSVIPIYYPTSSSLKSYNFYIFADEGNVTLIDAGVDSEGCFNYLKNVLNENGYSLNDLSQIIVTHNHEDHVGLVNRIVSNQDIPVYVPAKSIHRLKRDPDFFEMRIEFFQSLYEEMGCGQAGMQQVEKLKQTARIKEKNKIQTDLLPLKESDNIGPFEVIETPGHSPDHVVYLDRERKQLFCGDFIINHISSNALVEPDREGRRLKTVVQQKESLLKCRDLDVNIAFSGHGERINNYHECIQKRLTGIERKAERILTYVNQGLRTADEIARSLYKNKYESLFSLVMSEVIGHLDYLETNQRVQKKIENGVWHYERC